MSADGFLACLGCCLLCGLCGDLCPGGGGSDDKDRIVIMKVERELKRGNCTHVETGNKKYKQDCFVCKTCEEKKICGSCAKNCHEGHEIVENGKKKFFCGCGSEKDKGTCSCYNKEISI